MPSLSSQKIVLVAINARYTHTNLALRYLRNEATACGYEPVIREYTINQDILSIYDDLVRLAPEVIAFSVYIWNSILIERILDDLHKLLPEVRIILGGPEVSYNPEDWLARHPYVSHIVCGAGEAAFALLSQNRFIVADKILRIQNKPFHEIAFPYRDNDFAEFANRYIYYESSRGCPFSCAYCLSSRADQAIEYRDLDTTLHELERILAHDPIRIKFVDRTFNSDPERARAIWKKLMHTPGDTVFHFEVHPSLLEDIDLALLADCPPGRFDFEIGVQSTSAPSLDAISRPGAFTSYEQTIRKLKELKNIHLHLDLVAGLPHETLESFAQSFDHVLSLQPDHFQLGFLKLLPGTALRDNASLYGMASMKSAPYQVLHTATMSAKDFALLREIEQLLEITWNNGFAENVVRAVGVAGNYFAWFESLQKYCTRTGYDCNTKNKLKVTALLEAFQKENYAG